MPKARLMHAVRGGCGRDGPAGLAKLTASRMRWLLAILAAGLLAAFAVGCVSAWRSAVAADALTDGRELTAIKRAIGLAGEVAAAEVFPLVNGDEQAQKVAVGRDLPWLRSVFGSAVFPPDTGEHAIVLAPDGKPLFHSGTNAPPTVEEAAPVLDAAAPLVERVRRVYRNSVQPDPAEPGRFMLQLPQSGAMVRAIYDHDLGVVSGMPVLLTVVAIQPVSPPLLRQEDPTVLIDVRELVGNRVADLGRTAQVDDLRIVPVPRGIPPNPDGRVLTDAAGQPAAVAIWTRAAPAKRALASAVAPVVALLMLAAIGGLAGAIARREIAGRLGLQEEAVLRAARHDGATGLANRLWFRSRLEANLMGATAKPFGVVLIDIDELRLVNDTLGQRAGDAVAITIAMRLREAFGGGSALPARLGGDEFALITTPAATRAELAGLLATLVAALGKPVSFEGQSIPVTVAAGAAWCPADGASTDQILRHADIALMRARKDGRGKGVVFDPVSADAALARALAAADTSLAALRKVAAAGKKDGGSRPKVEDGDDQEILDLTPNKGAAA
jgi:diguanylate cyclase (GGDEF)-like protein